jgi:hypothetical protein
MVFVRVVEVYADTLISGAQEVRGIEHNTANTKYGKGRLTCDG